MKERANIRQLTKWMLSPTIRLLFLRFRARTQAIREWVVGLARSTQVLFRSIKTKWLLLRWTLAWFAISTIRWRWVVKMDNSNFQKTRSNRWREAIASQTTSRLLTSRLPVPSMESHQVVLLTLDQLTCILRSNNRRLTYPRWQSRILLKTMHLAMSRQIVSR